MSQIKSYLSLQSVPSLQFKTPIKGPIQNLITNHSMSLSNTLGSLDNKSLWNRRTFYNSQEVDRELLYQPHEFVEERSQEVENNSAVTLSPSPSPQDILELLASAKMVAFLAQKQQEDKARIAAKELAVKSLKAKIFLLEEQAQFLKREFEKKEKNIKSRSLSIRKMKRATSSSLHAQLLDMKLEIGQMKRTLSNKKATIDSRRNSEERRMYPGTERKREKIYVPIISNRFFGSPSNLQRPPSVSEYQTPSKYPRISHHQSSQEYHYMHPNAANASGQHSNKGSSGGRSKASMPGPPSSRKHPSDGNMPNVLQLIQQKLRIGNSNSKNLFFSQNIKGQARPNPEIPMPIRPSLFQMIAPALNQDIVQQTYNINVQSASNNNKQGSVKKQGSMRVDEEQSKLDYFDDIDIENEMLLKSQNSKKSIKALKQSSKGLTNKWKTGEEDKETLNMLKESIEAKPAQRGQMGTKLVVTNVVDGSFSVELPEKSRQHSPSLSPSPIQNCSQVEIFVMDNTEQNRSQSMGQEKKKSDKNIDRNNILNSDIGIIINDSIEAEDLPLCIESRVRNNPNSAQKLAIDQIQEMPEEAYSRTVTPASPVAEFRLTTHMEPSVESRYTETPRDTHHFEQMASSQGMAGSQGMINSQGSAEKSAPTTPVLSRPPSLLEQEEEYEDDAILDSIKLTTQSRHSFDPPSFMGARHSVSLDLPEEEDGLPSNLIQQPSPEKAVKEMLKEQAKEEVMEEEQDDILGIRLNNMSRISREKASNSNSSSHMQDVQSIPSDNSTKMAQSELAPQTRTNELFGDMEDNGQSLRNSTRSSIVKKNKGSAIQKSGARRESTANNNLNSSTNGLKGSVRGSSMLAMGKDLTSLQEVDQQEEEYTSNIVKKHQRHATDLQK